MVMSSVNQVNRINQANETAAVTRFPVEWKAPQVDERLSPPGKQAYIAQSARVYSHRRQPVTLRSGLTR
jgi:DNA-binding beta-propeller fold protein YncE